MDNFMEKISRQYSSTDMIRANGQADAAELDVKREQIMRFESQMDKVDSALNNMREVNLKNIEAAQNIQDLTKNSSDGIQGIVKSSTDSIQDMAKTSSDSIQGIAKTSSDSIQGIARTSSDSIQNLIRNSSDTIENLSKNSSEKIGETANASIAGINKTVDESLAKIAQIQQSDDTVSAIKSDLEELSNKIVTIRKEMEEYMHADHVKIYRNVQAALTEELDKQVKDIKASVKKKGALLPLVIVSAVCSLGSLAILVLSMLGML